MQKILEGGRFGPISQSFTNEILDSFHIMVGRCLNFLDPLGVIDRKIVDNVVKDVLHHRGQRRQFWNRGIVGKALQPANFDEYPITDQAILTEDIAE